MTARTIEATADLVGRERYVELTLFGALGTRALRATDPAVMVVLSGAAQGHAWRAQVLEELLPVSLGLPGVEQATHSPGEEFDSAVAELAEGSDEGVVEAIGHVLYPSMLAAYRAHLVTCSEVSEAHVALALTRVIADLEVQASAFMVPFDTGEGPSSEATSGVSGLLERLGGPFGAIG